VKRLLLLGGGHAHVQVLRSVAGISSKEFEIKLVTPSPLHIYSGMVPGVVAGHYAAAEAQIDLARLAGRAGVKLILDNAAAIDAGAKIVSLESGTDLDFDIASLNLGSLPNFFGIPGAREHAVSAKPFEDFLARWNDLLEEGPAAPRIAVAGAGAGGVELAMAMKFALEQRGRKARVVMYSEKNLFSGSVFERILRALKRFSIELRSNRRVTAVEPGPRVVTSSGREPFDALLWAAGAAPPPWLRDSSLALDGAGCVLVDATLRSVSHQHVFISGDTAALQGVKLPKSGVYAVRQGTVLADNLRRAIERNALTSYQPQVKQLSLISCGARYAIATRGNWSAEGAWAWRWKDWIDRRWIARFK